MTQEFEAVGHAALRVRTMKTVRFLLLFTPPGIPVLGMMLTKLR